MIDLHQHTPRHHIITIEDPVEFLHRHKKAHRPPARDCTATRRPSRGAARGAAPGAQGHPRRRDARPGDGGDRPRPPPRPGTWCSRPSTPSMRRRPSSASSASFDAGDEHSVRMRARGAFRCIISQRLVAQKSDGRIAAARDPDVDDCAPASTSRRARPRAARSWTPCATAHSTACSTSTARSSGWCAPASSASRLRSR